MEHENCCLMTLTFAFILILGDFKGEEEFKTYLKGNFGVSED